MTFYQELQVNQAGSKKIIRESASQREKLYHIAVYLTKIAITVAFCFVFVSLYSLGFGADNSIVGVVVLLYLLVFRSAHLCIRTGQSTLLLAGFFGIMAVGPHAANLAGPGGGLFINAAAIALLILFGCHEPRMFNQSTLVLGYLLLYGYDVSGHAYQMRLFGLAVGALLVCAVFYGNHRGNAYELCAGDILPAFDLRHPRSKWQLCQIICVPLVLFLAELSGMPRAMWAGIAAMSAILPAMDDMRYRVRWRIIGNIAGVCCFLVLYFLLPSSIYAYIGVIGGIVQHVRCARYCNQRVRTQKRGRSACRAEYVRRGVRAAVLPDPPPHFRPLGAIRKLSKQPFCANARNGCFFFAYTVNHFSEIS